MWRRWDLNRDFIAETLLLWSITFLQIYIDRYACSCRNVASKIITLRVNGKISGWQRQWIKNRFATRLLGLLLMLPFSKFWMVSSREQLEAPNWWVKATVCAPPCTELTRVVPKEKDRHPQHLAKGEMNRKRRSFGYSSNWNTLGEND